MYIACSVSLPFVLKVLKVAAEHHIMAASLAAYLGLCMTLS
jgi:hypothetical protein